MRLREDAPLDPEVLASLDAIDAVLAGEPVDPAHAELAELALLVSGERPELDSGSAARLDERVRGRFSPAPRQGKVRRPRRRWLWAPVAGLATAAGVAIAVAASGSPPAMRSVAQASQTASTPNAYKAPSPSAARGAVAPVAPGAMHAAQGSAAASSPAQPAAGLQPPNNGRKIVQSAQLALTADPSRIDAVAQEVFDVVGQDRGIVQSSSVTATGGPSSYAQFQLSIPSPALPQAMASLSTLRFAHVGSRTDATQDVTNQYQSDVRALADARALRSSLLKQLANATTPAQIASLTARIHDADASISSDEATLRSLGHQVDFSQLSLTVNGGSGPLPVQGGMGGFSLRQAAHDAGRVLTVAAGVALIALAALVPAGLLGALGWWGFTAARRVRRERALDVV